MGQIVNLSAARKGRDRLRQRQQADENAVKFGRTKAQKAREAADAQRADQTLDGARRDSAQRGAEPPENPQDMPCPPAR